MKARQTRTLSTLFARNVDAGLLLLRLALGIVFVLHGWQKATEFGVSGLSGSLASLGIPFPGVNAAILIATELGGGLALLAGAFAARRRRAARIRDGGRDDHRAPAERLFPAERLRVHADAPAREPRGGRGGRGRVLS